MTIERTPAGVLVAAATFLSSCASSAPPVLTATTNDAGALTASADPAPVRDHQWTVVDGAARDLTDADLAPQINVKAAFMHRVPELRDHRPGYKPTGQGVRVGVWEGGPVRSTHAAFGGRVGVAETDLPSSDHATHVAGTIAAQEVPGSVEGVEGRGVAAGAHVLSYDFDGDPAAELASAVQRMNTAESGAKMRVTNHSYGYPREIPSSDREFDDVIRKDPRVIAIVAAGNATCVCAFDAGRCVRLVTRAGRTCKVDEDSGRLRMPLLKEEYETLGSPGAAKNVITVGAMVDLFRIDDAGAPGSLGFVDRSRIEPTYFSSVGPSRDGRIKPDVIANGYELVSPTTPAPDQRGRVDGCQSISAANVRRCYKYMSGTSMATPLTSGVAALLQDLSHAKSGDWLLADDLKAILIHSAIGKDMRPTYLAGWGAYRADIAGDIVDARRADYLPPENGLVFTRLSVGPQPLSYIVKRIPGEHGRITAGWLDDAGAPAAGGLHRDIDIALVRADASGAEFLPWTLDPREPRNLAVRNLNRVDNVERIDVSVDEDLVGEWTLTFTRAKPLIGAPIDFALVAQGLVRTN